MKILGGFLLKQKRGLLLLVFCSIVVVGLSLLNTSYIARVTDDTYRVTTGGISKEAYLSGLTNATIVMVLIMIVMAIANIASGYFAGGIAVSVTEELRNVIYEKALSFSSSSRSVFHPSPMYSVMRDESFGFACMRNLLGDTPLVLFPNFQG